LCHSTAQAAPKKIIGTVDALTSTLENTGKNAPALQHLRL